MYSRNWSVKAEYLYVDLGSTDYRFVGTTFIGAPHTIDSFPADLTFHAVGLGVNYPVLIAQIRNVRYWVFADIRWRRLN